MSELCSNCNTEIKAEEEVCRNCGEQKPSEVYHLDPEEKTFLYIMYIDDLNVLPNPSLTSTEVVCRWYVNQEDQANDCSSSFMINTGCSSSPRYCSFLVVSLADLNTRDLALTLTVSSVESGEHLAACFTNISEFSTAESFVDIPLTVSTADQEFAHLTLHTAAQQRWQKGTPIVPQALAYFVNPAHDSQGHYLHQHIVQDAGQEEQTSAAQDDSEQQRHQAEQLAEAERQRELDEKHKKDEDERRRRDAEREQKEAEDRRRREEDERLKRRELEDRTRDAERDGQRREIDDRRREEARERQRREEEDQRRADEERDRERRLDDSDRRYNHDSRALDSYKSSSPHGESSRHRDELASRTSMSGRWAEEDRRRLEEEERWRQRQRERDEEAQRRKELERERWMENTARDHQRLEDEREKLRQNAKRERAREMAVREGRSQERRKQQEATAARLVDGGFSDTMSNVSRAVTPNPASNSWNHTPNGPLPDSVVSSPVSKRHASLASTAQPHNIMEEEAPYVEKHTHNHNAPHSNSRQSHSHPHSRQSHSHQHSRHSQPENHRTSMKISKHSQAYPSRHVPGLEESDHGCESEGSDENHFQGDNFMFEDDRRRSSSPQPAPAVEKKNARAPHPNRLLASATPARAASRRVANNVAARLEHLREEVVSNNDSFGAPAGIWAVSDAEEEPNAIEQRSRGGRGNSMASGVSAARQTSPQNLRPSRSTGRTTTGKSRCEVAVQTSERAPAPKSVLAAALQDVNASDPIDFGQQQAAPVAAAEEGLLRLLLLQKQLHEADGGSGEHSSALADATAGLVPRMLQVLDVAKNVCEANRTKLKNFCQERDVNHESPGGYLQSQLTALDKLRSQYSTLLLPTPAPTQSPYGQGLQSGHIFQPNLNMLGHSSRTPLRTMETESVHGLWSDLGAPSSVGPYSSTSPRRLLGPTPPHLGSGVSGGNNAPLDPGGQGPQAPLLRPGGGASTPPTAKFREGRLPDAHQSIIPALPFASPAMAVDTHATSSTTEYPAAKRLNHRSVSPPKAVVASSGTSTPPQMESPASEREDRTDFSRRLQALQQIRAGAKDVSLPAHDTGLHQRLTRNQNRIAREAFENNDLQPMESTARKRSTSQPQEARTPVQGRSSGQPRGDGYLKILQKLQAHAPASGTLRAKLMDGAGTASREKLGLQSRRALEDSPALSRVKSQPTVTRSLSSAATLGRARRRLAAEDSDDSMP